MRLLAAALLAALAPALARRAPRSAVKPRRAGVPPGAEARFWRRA